MPPWLLLAILIALLFALGYQIVRSRSYSRLPLYWIVVLAAFLLAETAAESSGLESPQLGELQIIPDLIGVAIAVGALRAANL